MRDTFTRWLFPPESDKWLGVLRIGLGLTVAGYALSLGDEWTYVLARTGKGLIGRQVSEAVLTMESPLLPRISWLVRSAEILGIGEHTALLLLWSFLLGAGCCLIAGFACRATAITAWFLQLCAAKSATLLSYGVDNFITIGLFYLMLTPLPDRYSLDAKLRGTKRRRSYMLGFFRRVLQVHLCLIYFFGGLTKCLGSGWWNGTSLWRALIRPPFNILPPEMIVTWKSLFPLLGISIWFVELGYSFFIWQKRTRMLWLTLVCAMHLAIGLTMGMYLFALVMIVLNLAAFGPSLHVRDEATIGDCGCKPAT